MKILIISPEYPYPTDNGAKRRIRASLEFFSQNHDVTFVALREAGQEKHPDDLPVDKNWEEWLFELSSNKYTAVLQSLLSKHNFRQIRFRSPEMTEKINHLLQSNQYDLIWIHFLSSVDYLQSWWETTETSPLLVLDQHNVFTQFWESFVQGSANILLRKYTKSEKRKADRLQSIWFPRFDLILTINEDDLEETAQYSLKQPPGIIIAPNGVDLENFTPAARTDHLIPNPVLVFAGSMSALMNEDAVLWFYDRVWPQIKQNVPETEFWIVGRDPSSKVRQLSADQGVKVTGSVKDIRDYVNKGDVFVVPLRFGGGSKLKTLEAMALGIPLVSTEMGVRGIEAESGKHVLMAQDAEGFAAAVLELIQHPEKAALLAREARKLVERQYSWKTIMSDVEKVLESKLEEI